MPSLVERTVGTLPDRLVMEVDDLLPVQSLTLGLRAVIHARRHAPKLSGASSSRLRACYGEGFFGIHWLDDWIWYQEEGTQPFTMRKLAGKTIPMWIDDPTGTERAKNPRAKTRITTSGKVQVLIFRRAAPIGQRKTIRRRQAGQVITVDVPASYPGAPGRIAVREARAPYTTEGRIAGRIARGNVGVRWRHPGISPRRFIENGLILAAEEAGIPRGRVIALRVG